jgi:activator of 2-hydroxyglutaryl-CoA dehydratase
MQQLLVGLDVGSTTVKAIVVDAATDATLWQDYQRHETRQPEKVLEFLQRMEADTGISPENTRIFITGSGKIRAGSPRRGIGRGKDAPRSVLGHRAWRTGRQDHRFQR